LGGSVSFPLINFAQAVVVLVEGILVSLVKGHYTSSKLPIYFNSFYLFDHDLPMTFIAILDDNCPFSIIARDVSID
jgi:hypothetical protein